MLNPLCGLQQTRKFWKRWGYQTMLPASWEACIQVRRQQLEPDMEQNTGSKLRKEFIKALYCHLAYLTYMQRAWVLSHFTHVWLFATLLSVACQLVCPWGLSRQEYWSGLPCPPPGDHPHPGIKPASLKFPTLAGGFFTTSATWEVPICRVVVQSPSHVWCFVTPWIAAYQASLSITISQSLPKFMSIA